MSAHKTKKDDEPQHPTTTATEATASPPPGTSVSRVVLGVLRGWVSGVVKNTEALAATLPEGALGAEGATGLMSAGEARAHGAVAEVVRQRPELFVTNSGDGTRAAFDIEGLTQRLERYNLLASFVAIVEPAVARTKLAMKELSDDIRARVEPASGIAHAVAGVDQDVAATLEPSTAFRNRGAVGRKRNAAKNERAQRKAAKTTNKPAKDAGKETAEDSKTDTEPTSTKTGPGVESALLVNGANGQSRGNGQSNGASSRS